MRLPLLIVLLCVASTAAGCAVPGWRQTISIAQEEAYVVQVERHSDGQELIPEGFVHPARVAAKRLAYLYRGLKYGAADEPKFAIQPDAVDALAAAVSTGLSKAGPSDRVRFSVQNPGVKGLIFRRAATTTRGVVFIRPAGVLNVAFDVVNLDLDHETMDSWGDPLESTLNVVVLELPAGVQRHQDATGTTKPMWFTMSLATEIPKSPPPAVAPAPVPPPRQASQSGPVSQSPSEKFLARVRLLEELHDEDILSDQEYREIRKRLLDRTR